MANYNTPNRPQSWKNEHRNTKTFTRKIIHWHLNVLSATLWHHNHPPPCAKWKKFFFPDIFQTSTIMKQLKHLNYSVQCHCFMSLLSAVEALIFCWCIHSNLVHSYLFVCLLFISLMKFPFSYDYHRHHIVSLFAYAIIVNSSDAT